MAAAAAEDTETATVEIPTVAGTSGMKEEAAAAVVVDAQGMVPMAVVVADILVAVVAAAAITTAVEVVVIMKLAMTKQSGKKGRKAIKCETTIRSNNVTTAP